MAESFTAEYERGKYWVDLVIEDRGGGESFDLRAEVDTGCAQQLALPLDPYTDLLTLYRGSRKLGGAAIGESDMYSITVKEIGGIEIDFNTTAVISLKNHHHPLVGLGLLRKMMVCLDGLDSDSAMSMLIDKSGPLASS